LFFAHNPLFLKERLGKMRVAICDDIRTQAEELARLVVRYYNGNVDVRIYENGKTLATAFPNNGRAPFDLIFLDILMPEHTGMTVAEHIRKFNEEVPIIFVTSTLDYSIQGYRVDAAAYITKPINAKELKQALDKLEKRRARITDERLVVTAEGVVTSIPFTEIRSIEKSGRKTLITRINKPPIHTNQPISEIAQQFEKYTQFAIFSQSNYINLTNALEFNKKERLIKMRDGSKISVARERMKSLLDQFLMKYSGK